MSNFKFHDTNSAPEKSKPLLEKSQKAYGMIPNLHAVMAESPGILEGYQTLHELFANSSFDADELTVVWQTINVEHECTYCVPAHTGIAHSMNVDAGLIEALRDKKRMPTDKLQTLHETTLSIVRNRGRISEAELNKFYEAGYGHQQVLEIILALSQKVMSNYVNHIAETPVDDAFKKFDWKP